MTATLTQTTTAGGDRFLLNHDALFSGEIARHPEPKVLTLYAYVIDHASRGDGNGLRRGQYRLRYPEFQYWFRDLRKLVAALTWLEQEGYVELEDGGDGSVIVSIVSPQPWLQL